jgi:hypothetical protein
MPRVTIKTGIVSADGQEEVLSEHLCDWPECANVAEHVVGVVAELRVLCVVCRLHAALLHKRGSGGT